MNTITNLNTFPIGNTLDGVNIITEEINTLSLLVDGTNSMLADLNMDNHMVKNLQAGVDSLDAVNKSQLDLKADTSSVNTQLSTKADKSYVDNNFVNLTSNQTIAGTKTFSNQVIFNGATKTNLVATDIPNAGSREWLTTGVQTISGVKTFANSSVFSGPTFTRSGTDTFINSTNFTISGSTITNLNNGANCNNKNLTNVLDPINAQDGATKNYVDTQANNTNYLLRNGTLSMTGNLNMNSANKIINVVNPSNPQDVATKNYVDTQSTNTNYVLRNGNLAMTGNLDMNYTNRVRNVADPAFNQDVATKNYVDNQTNNTNYLLRNGTLSMTGNLNMNTKYITNVVNPSNPQDVATKNYVDSGDNLKVNKAGDTMTGGLIITENTGSGANASAGTLTLRHNDADGKSSIVFNSNINFTSDYGFIEYRDNYNTGYSENSALIIGVENDATGETIEDKIYFKLNGADRIAISGDGKLGINKISPTEMLDVNGNAKVSGSVSSNTQFYMGNATSSQRDRLLIADNSAGFLFFNEEGMIGRFIPGTLKWSVDREGNGTFRNISRTAWNVGDTIQTKIFNQNTSGTGLATVTSGSNLDWKTINFTAKNSNLSESVLSVKVDFPYFISGSDNDAFSIKIMDTTGASQTIFFKSQYYKGSGGGGTRSATISPVICSYTPTESLSTLTRALKIEIKNDSDDDLYMCKGVVKSGSLYVSVDLDYYTIEITEIKK